MKTAYSYIRFSTPQQQWGDSERRQEEQSKAFCRVHGLTLSERTFADRGISAKAGKNYKQGALKDLISMLKSGDYLLVEDTDRLSREDPLTALTMLRDDIVAKGVTVCLLSSNIQITKKNMLDLSILLPIFVRASIGYGENVKKSQRVREAKLAKLEEIKSGSVVKHNCVPKYFSWSDKTKRYEHNEKTRLVGRMVSDYLEGKSLYEIAGNFNRKGVPSMKTGGKWNPRSVKCILKSRCLIGEYLGNPNFFEPIIDTDTFNKVQLLLDQNTKNRGKAADKINIFKSVVYCECGQRMNVLTQSTDYRTKKKWKRVYRYIRCCSVAQGNPCDFNRSVPLDDIEDEFFVMCLVTDPRQLLASPASKEIKTIRQTILKHTEAVKALTVKMNKLITLEDDPNMPVDQIRKQLGAFQRELQTEQTLLEKAKMDLARLETAPDQFDQVKEITKQVEAVPLGDTRYAEMTAKYDEMVKRVSAVLTDNAVRQKLRLIMPRLIQKIVVNSKHRSFRVFNQYGKEVYKSESPFTAYQWADEV